MKKLLGFALLFFLSAIPAFGQSKAGSVTAASTDCSVSGSCVSMTLSTSAGAATITLGGSFSGTLNFELSGDNGVTWTAAPTASSTSAGVTNFNVAGYSNIRVRGNPFASGTANVTIFAGAGSKLGAGVGVVTSVSGTAPIASSGGTTPAISCPTCTTSAASIVSGNVVTGAGGQAVQDSGTALSALQTTANVGPGCQVGCSYALGLGDAALATGGTGSTLGTANQPAAIRFYNDRARSISTGCFFISTASAGGNADVSVYSVSGTALTQIWHTGAKSTTSTGQQCATATTANLLAKQNYYIFFCADNTTVTLGQLMGASGNIPLMMGGAGATANTYGLDATDVSTGGVCPATATTTNITNNNAKLLATWLQVFN